MNKLISFCFVFTIGVTAFALPPVVQMEGQNYFQFGDMLMDAPHLNENSVLRGARPLQVDTWDDGVIPITFTKDIPPAVREMVFQACRTWAQYGKIQCREGKYKNKTLLVSRKGFAGMGGGCFSTLGQSPYFMGVKRRMNLHNVCWSRPIVLHEMGHALGLTHEHQRPDRDKYVTIDKDNISKGFAGMDYKLNFESQESELFTPYDFLSIMHYYYRAGAKESTGDTIIPKPGYEKYRCIMGNVEELSEGDKHSVAQLYGAQDPKNAPPITKSGEPLVPAQGGSLDLNLIRQMCKNSR